jgi:two-component system, chemotaxis family, chemotaxis protein CheY
LANILVVDDSATTRRIISQMAGKLGHTVVAEAKTGIESFEMFEKFKPDLVTMDMEMPEGDGVSALKNIIGKYPEAVIVMITTVGAREKVLECIQLGAKNYIVKPMDEQKFVSVINEVIAKFITSNNASEKGEDAKSADKINPDNPDSSNFKLSGSFVLDIYKKMDDDLVNKIINSIQGTLMVKPLKFIFRIHFTKNEFNANDFDKIVQTIHKSGGTVEIVWK